MSAVSGASGVTPTGTSASQTSNAASKTLADRDTFLKLLIAQIRNQNPLDPTDGVQFMTQLAQFSSVEQNVQISQDMSAIRKLLEGQLGTSTADSGDSSKTQDA